MNLIKVREKMDTIFMISKNSKISHPNRLLLKFPDEIDLKRSNKYTALSNFSIYYLWRNVKMSCKKNKSKMSASTWNDQFELPDGLYSVSDI